MSVGEGSEVSVTTNMRGLCCRATVHCSKHATVGLSTGVMCVRTCAHTCPYVLCASMII